MSRLSLLSAHSAQWHRALHLVMDDSQGIFESIRGLTYLRAVEVVHGTCGVGPKRGVQSPPYMVTPRLQLP